MASRYALYTRRKDEPGQCFSFSESCPALERAIKKKKDNDKWLPNIETVIIESTNPDHRIDPYHIHFAEKGAA
jgi:hypothetical protein